MRRRLALPKHFVRNSAMPSILFRVSFWSAHASPRRFLGSFARSLIGLALLLWSASVASAQDVRRARPVDEPPAPRAMPAQESADKTLRSLVQEFSETPAGETERSDQRQLDYANALFTRKRYDLAIPARSRHRSHYPGPPGAAASCW